MNRLILLIIMVLGIGSIINADEIKAYMPSPEIIKSSTQSAKGLQIGSVVYSSDGTKSTSALYYDIRGNVTESQERTSFGSLRTTTNTYTYSGQPLKSTMTEGLVTVITENTYDAKSGLLTATDVTVNGVKQRVSAVTYDDLGRIKSITRGAALNSGGTVNYTYNIHGQTKSITAPGLTQHLYYADGPGTKLYNGSVSAMTWTMGTDQTERGYKYSYNGYGWLTSAEYGECSTLTGNKDRYTEKSIAFTRNGGISRLQRFGQLAGGTYGYVDNLTVTYSGNRTATVSDAAPAVTQNGSMDYAGGSAAKSFGNNAFGALTSDASRGITSVSYDNAGNPTAILYSNGCATRNEYSATGEKIKTVHVTGVSGQSMSESPADFAEAYSEQGSGSTETAAVVTAMSVTEYHGNVIYRDGAIDMVLFPGGHATLSGSAVTFHYYTQDYLGNNRAVVNGSTGAIEQTVAYYPHGGVIPTLGNPSGGQPYKFGGKELITANGLNEYDFGARQYWTAVPGFTRIDPLCEETQSLSPYLYCGNNPVNAIDPDGRSTWVTARRDGTYQVVGGDLDDDDLNIYVIEKDKSGKSLVKGKSIGKTPTMTSFYDSGEVIGEKGDWAYGAIIDPTDQSGVEFLRNLIKENPPLLDGYAVNAGNGKKYDFKACEDAPYRGMPLFTAEDGTRIYTSARDIGNIGAGYIAGANGVPWSAARLWFDGYQSYVMGYPTIEGLSSRNAQFYGWSLGYFGTPPAIQMANFVRSQERAKGFLILQIVKSLVGLR